MSARDRMSDGYEPRFDIDYEYGRQAELLMGDIIDSLRSGDGRVEVKRDGVAVRTGNFYVEHACRRRDGWQPSGIASADAELYAFVLGLEPSVAIVVGTDLLRAYCSWLSAKQPRSLVEQRDGSHPTKGIAAPIHGLIEFIRQQNRNAA